MFIFICMFYEEVFIQSDFGDRESMHFFVSICQVTGKFKLRLNKGFCSKNLNLSDACIHDQQERPDTLFWLQPAWVRLIATTPAHVM